MSDVSIVENDPPSRNRNTSIVCFCVAILFSVLSTLRLHGFSIGGWHRAIAGTPPPKILFGQSQSIRSDDAVAVIPQILSQAAHDPPFPVFNTLIGAGNCNMRINYAMPIRDWTTIFRPQVWGYFVSVDFGLAWHWWFNFFGSWLVLFLILIHITGNRIIQAVCGATAVLFSAFFQYWSLNCAPSAIYSGLTLLSFAGVLRACSKSGILFALACFAYSATAMAFTFSFMPYLVTLFYLVLFAGLGFAFRIRHEIDGKHSTTRRGGLVFAIALVLVVMVFFVYQNWNDIKVAGASTYPGQRFSTGGEGTWPLLFRGLLFTWTHPGEWPQSTHNICEAASFILCFPLSAALLTWRWYRRKARPDAFQIALILFILAAIIWYLIGFPSSLAQYIGMSRSPSNRATLAIGIADVLLLFSVLRCHIRDHALQSCGDPFAWLMLCGWVVLLAVTGSALHELSGSYGVFKIIGAGACTAALGAVYLFAPRWLAPSLAVMSIAATITFNPLSQGGTAFISDNDLVNEIKTIDTEARRKGSSPTWVTFGFAKYDIYLPNLFRMLGLKALDGVHPYPQPEMWLKIDPDRKYREIWNRYAHVRFALPRAPNGFTFERLKRALILVRIHPDDPHFASLGITHVLLNGDITSFAGIRNLRYLASVKGKHIFELVQPKVANEAVSQDD